MDLPLDELFKRAQNSIHQDSGKTTDIDLIVKETGLPKQFVNYVIESVILHYNAIELLKHMVIFVSEKCKQEGINVNSTITATFLKKIDPICRTHKEDSAFFPDYKEDNRDTSLDFPLLTRFAIVATYCASYNPPVTDQRFFFKTDISTKRRKGGGNFSAKNSKENFMRKAHVHLNINELSSFFSFFVKILMKLLRILALIFKSILLHR